MKSKRFRSAFFHRRRFAGLCLVPSAAFLILVILGAFSDALAQKSATPADRSGRFVYLIEFAEPGLLHRSGATVGGAFDPNRREVRAQQQLLIAEQAAHVQAINRVLGRALEVTHHFVTTHSGIAARMTPAEAELARSVPGVKSIRRERLDQTDAFRLPAVDHLRKE